MVKGSERSVLSVNERQRRPRNQHRGDTAKGRDRITQLRTYPVSPSGTQRQKRQEVAVKSCCALTVRL